MVKKIRHNYLKLILIILVVILILILADYICLFFSNQESQLQTDQAQPSTQNLVNNNLVTVPEKQTITSPIISTSSPVIGNPQAPVTIFEYSSFACPYSLKTQPIISDLLEKYKNKIKLVWKDLPTEDVYNQAMSAHLAARCAQEQGKFWPYADLLWQSQKDFSTSTLKSLAKKIKIDQNKFNSCFDTQKYQQLINNDESEAAGLLIPGTPHFYINNQEISGSDSLENFERIIQIELNRKK